MGKRLRSSKQLMVISCWTEADAKLRRIGELQHALEHHTSQATTAINTVKESLASMKAETDAEIALIVESLQAYAENHHDDFGDARSRELDYGKLGWRKSTKIHVKERTLDLIKKKLKPALQKLCIIIKETVSKEGLAELTDEQLALVEANREVKDVFFAEPLIQEAAEK